MNSLLIDIIFVGFLLIVSFLGYKRGFITRLYDVLTTILVLFLTILLTPYLSKVIDIYKYDQTDFVATIIGTFLNYILVFIIIFIVLFIIKKLVGLLIKPVLKSITNKFTVTSFMDKTLGVILSFVEAIFITYLVLIIAFIPFQSNSSQLLNETVLTKHVLKIVPSVSEKVIELSQMIHNPEKTPASSLQSMTELLLTMDDLNLVDKTMIEKILKESITDELMKEKITLSSSQIQDLEDLLKETGYNSKDIKSIISNVNVSGE